MLICQIIGSKVSNHCRIFSAFANSKTWLICSAKGPFWIFIDSKQYDLLLLPKWFLNLFVFQDHLFTFFFLFTFLHLWKAEKTSLRTIWQEKTKQVLFTSRSRLAPVLQTHFYNSMFSHRYLVWSLEKSWLSYHMRLCMILISFCVLLRSNVNFMWLTKIQLEILFQCDGKCV